MINSEPDSGQNAGGGEPETSVDTILRSGAGGAAVLAGLATAIVVAIWLAFYLWVFVPRAMTP